MPPGATDQAVQHYGQALQAEPANAELPLSLGNRLLTLGLFAEAAASYVRPHHVET